MGTKGKEPEPIDDAIGQRAVEVGLITANQLREVLMELTRLASGPADVGAALVSRGLLSAAQLDALSGTALKRLGKYVIVRELGRGGMGVVYEAEDSELDRRVALKMLLGSLHSDPGEAALEEERFVREARLSANLPKHPQIIGVYEAGVLEGRRFIAMEFIEGKQFSDWRRQGSITLRQQITVLRDTAMAVDHAHRHGIIHRDLKPANILVDRRNHPHVADFGLAKRTNQSATLSLTSSGMVMGTPAYMSPEQAHGGKDVDLRTDLWALGVMLYEILTGRVPFEADSPVKVLMKTVNDPVPAPSSLLRGPHASLDAAIEAVVMKALTKNPRQRYASARAFADDLGRWLRGERVSVQTETPVKIKPSWIAGAAAGLVIAAGLAWVAVSPSAAEREARRVDEYVAQGDQMMKAGKYSTAIGKYDLALELDKSNGAALNGRKAAEKRLLDASRPAAPAAPDPARIREAMKKELADLDASLAGFRETGNYGQLRDVLAQAARRRPEDEWSREIASRLEALRKTVDESFAAAKAKAVAAKKAGDAAGLEAAVRQVKAWKWPGLVEELDLEIARTKEAAAPPPAPVDNGPLKAPAGIRPMEPIGGSGNALNALAYSPDGKFLISTAFDGVVRVWDVAARAEKVKLAERFSGRCCAWSPDGRWLAAGSQDGSLRVWDAARFQGRTLTVLDNQVMGTAFTKDSKSLVSVSVDGVVRVWDVETGLTMREMKGHPKGALGLAISPDGRHVAVGAGEGTMKIWELSTGKELKRLEVPSKTSVFVLSYSPDGRTVAFGGDDGAVYLADASTGAVRTLGAYGKGVRGLAWSPDGRWIATTSVDPALRLWDPKDGSYTGFEATGGFYAAVFSPAVDRLAAGAGDWTLRLWELPPAKK